jgi:hypothetical protein
MVKRGLITKGLKLVRYCCVADIILSQAKDKNYAMTILSKIYDKRKNEKKRKTKTINK